MKNRIKELRDARGLSMDALGDMVKSTGSTINKLEKGQIKLDTTWMTRLGQALGVQPIEILVDPEASPAGELSEDAEPYIPAPTGSFARLQEPNRDLWQVKSDALSELGITKSDLILVDISQAAIDGVQMGDPVVVQLYDPEELTKATTLLRQFIEPNLLITNSQTANAPSLNMRTTNVHIKGRIIHHIRTIRR